MTTTAVERPELPRWIESINRASVFGEPNQLKAHHQILLWRDHFSRMYADPAVSPLNLTTSVIRSSLAHMKWRLIAGPPTAVAPALMTISIGVVLLTLSTSSLFDAAGATSMVALIVIAGGALILSEARATERSRLTRAAVLLISLGLLVTAYDYIANPIVRGDTVLSIGTLINGLALMPLAVTSKRSVADWPVWAALGSGVLVNGLGNLVASFNYTDSIAANVALALFIVETATGITLLRWALEQRTYRTRQT